MCAKMQMLYLVYMACICRYNYVKDHFATWTWFETVGVTLDIHMYTTAKTPGCRSHHPQLWSVYRRTGNFRGWKFLQFSDSVYYANISRFLFSRLKVTTKISLLSNSPTCALNRTRSGQRNGGSWKARQYIQQSQSTLRWTCWLCATC